MRVLIVGAGTVGFGVANELASAKNDVWLVDYLKSSLEKNEADGFSAIHGDIFHTKIQQQVRIASMDMVIAVTENDATNMLICQIAKSFNVPIKIARVKNSDLDEEGYPLTIAELGIDKLINTDKLVIKSLDQLVKVPSSTSVFAFKDSEIVLRGFFVPEDSRFIDKTIAEIGEGMAEYSFLILAISRNQKMIVPRGDIVIHAGDEVFVLMHNDTVEFFLPLLFKKVRPIKHVLIYGATTVGIGIAKALIDSVPQIMIIDSDIAMCEMASKQAIKATVLCSDITSEDFQGELDLDTVDVFIAATHNDEQNFIASLMMKNKIPKNSRTLVVSHREEYDALIPKVGLGEAINPRLIAVGEILSHISARDILSIAKFNYGDAEAIEIIVPEKSGVCKKAIKDLKFPADAIIGTIIRGEEIIIPQGTTVLQPNDKIIVFTLNQCRDRVKTLFEEKKSWF
jgi:trk system potassium uptake protein TrkA